MKKVISVLVFICMITLLFTSCGHEHKASDWVVESEATVLTDGSEYGICDCGEKLTRSIPKIGAENALAGKWISKAYASNPIYRYLSFTGATVRFGTNLYGSDITSATWDCSYTVEGTKLTLTTDDGTEFYFTLQDLGSKLRVFDDSGSEYVYSE